MQTLKKLALSIALIGAAVLAQPSLAQTSDAMTRGEIRKVDKGAGKVTIKHEEIKSLDMPPMTMVFTVKDKSQLEKLQAGDTIKFVAVSENGKLVVTDIQANKP